MSPNPPTRDGKTSRYLTRTGSARSGAKLICVSFDSTIDVPSGAAARRDLGGPVDLQLDVRGLEEDARPVQQHRDTRQHAPAERGIEAPRDGVQQRGPAILLRDVVDPVVRVLVDEQASVAASVSAPAGLATAVAAGVIETSVGPARN
jgi:hypothetical protein